VLLGSGGCAAITAPHAQHLLVLPACLQDLLRRTKTDSQLLTIVILTGVLIVLTIIAVL
jgi:hypothetical protein